MDRKHYLHKIRNCIDTDVIASKKSNGPTNHIFGPTEIVHLSTSVDAVSSEDISPCRIDSQLF